MESGGKELGLRQAEKEDKISNGFPESRNSAVNKEHVCQEKINISANTLKEEFEFCANYTNPSFILNENEFEGVQSKIAFQGIGNSNFIGSKDNVLYLSNSSKKGKNIEFQIDDIDEDTVCGFGPFKPAWLQKWATPRSYLILYTIIGILQGTYYAYFIGILSTIEKRFAFKSKVSGVILIVDEVTPLLLGIFVGYLGSNAHRPRMVGFGMLMHVLCCLGSALPFFVYGPAQHLTSLVTKNETGPEVCNNDLNVRSCDLDDRPPTLVALGIFIIAHFLKGFGNLAYYAIGLAYMDDNAKKKNTPVYLGITYSLRMLGPLLGYLLSSAFLKIYENPLDDPGFGTDDPRWIGGWWMGFILQAILVLIFTIPLFLFPRRLPSHSKPDVKTGKNSDSNVRTKLLDLLKAMKRLLKNPLYVFLVINMVLIIFGNFGYFIFLPKYMEHQFKLSASDASLYSGPPGIAAIMISTTAGGIAIWKYMPSVKVLLGGMVATDLIGAAGFLLLMIPQCNKVEMTNFGLNDKGLILGNECNLNCNCSTSAFTPVCGPDGETTYFSPCYAGCSGDKKDLPSSENKKVYENCSCLSNFSDYNNNVVKEGFCVDEECWSQALGYIVSLPIFQTLTSFLHVGHTMILLRSIHPDDKSVALGAFETFICLFGFIPYLLVFGNVVDTACLVWEESCGETGNCWFYDMDKLKLILHGTCALFSFLSCICLFVMTFLSGKIQDLYADSDTQSEINEKANSDVKSAEGTAATKL